VSSWGSFTVSNLTSVLDYSLAFATNSGVRVHYAWAGGATPTVGTPSASTARLTWLLIRGADAAGNLAMTATNGGTGLVQSNIQASKSSPTPPAGSLMLHAATILGNRAFILSPEFDVRIGRCDPVNGFVHAGVAAHTWAADATVADWSVWNTSPTTSARINAATVAVWVIPAAATGSPFFDKTKWRRVSPALEGPVYSLNDLGVSPPVLAIPEEDRNYSLDFDEELLGLATNPVGITFPVPRFPNEGHSIRVSYRSHDTDRRAYHQWSTPANYEEDGPLPLQGANFWHPGVTLEPGPFPGAVSTITYEWDPVGAYWYPSAWAGEVLVRDHGGYHSDSERPGYGLRVYFSPEVRSTSTYADDRAAMVSAYSAIPTSTRRLLNSRGVCIDHITGQDGYQSLSWRWMDPLSTAWSGVSGFFTEGTNVATAPIDNGSPPGRVGLHELGHALDYVYLPAIGQPDGINPASAPYGPIHSETDFVALYAALTDKPGSYYRSTITEWVAQASAVYWATHIPGYDYTAEASWTALRNVLTNSDTGLWDDLVDYMVGIGAWLPLDSWE
jgi:hypothetical protein